MRTVFHAVDSSPLGRPLSHFRARICPRLLAPTCSVKTKLSPAWYLQLSSESQCLKPFGNQSVAIPFFQNMAAPFAGSRSHFKGGAEICSSSPVNGERFSSLVGWDNEISGGGWQAGCRHGLSRSAAPGAPWRKQAASLHLSRTVQPPRSKPLALWKLNHF